MATDISRQLTNAERKELAREFELVKLYEMRTCIERRYTLEEQAQALGVSTSTIKRWAASEEFKRVAAQLRPAASIMLSAARDYVTEELLPLSVRRAKELLEDPETKDSTLAAVIREIWRQTFGAGDPVAEHDAQGAMEFLKSQGVSIGTMNVIVQNVAPEYRDKLLASLPETVEGEVVEGG
jgi:transcriptional regulator with XRE-family HTH domain